MKQTITYIMLFLGISTFAQIEQGEATIQRSDDFEQESVTVERIYEPKVEAAEKIKQTPQIAPMDNNKLPVTYATKDIEAASDFETTTINAEELPVDDSQPYNNYLRIGYGNRASLILDGFGSYELENENTVGGSLSYRATDGNIPDTVTETDKAKLSAEAFYKLNLDESMADIRLGGSLNKLNLYGLHEPTVNIEDMDVSEQYNNVYVQGRYTAFNHIFLDEVKVKAGYFSDSYDANESSFDLNASFKNDEVFSLNFGGGMDFGASADANINYSSTNFELVYDNSYNYLTLGVAPKLHFANDILQIAGGVNLQYNTESETNISDLHIFPQVEVLVTAIPELTLYGGLDGGLFQNRYQSLVDKNPYLFANQALATTVNKIEFFAGVRGDIGENFRYDAKAQYQDLEHIPFFTKNVLSVNEPYAYNNAFNTMYDNGNRTSINAMINYLGVQNLNLGANLLFQSYQLDNLNEAYDQPAIKVGINADYKFLEDRLIVGGDMFVIEKRKSRINFMAVDAAIVEFDLDAYIDLNANATYLITDRWSAFVEVNNILNDNYERYLDYNVQGITAIGGIMFRF